VKFQFGHLWTALGLILAGGAYLLCTVWVAKSWVPGVADDTPTLRVSHWLLETGYRESLDEIGKLWELENLRAGRRVRFEQVVVPTRVYAAWMRTNLVGATAPDLIYVKRANGATEEVMARYFEPLNEIVSQPNPHNANTPLAGLRWGDTFVDNLAITGTSAGLADIYAIPTSAVSVRLYFNRALLREITGRSELPDKFPDFIAMCTDIRKWSEKTGRRVSPIAGSRYNTTLLFNLLIGGLTQTTTRQIDLRGDLAVGPAELLFAMSQGNWSATQRDQRAALAALHQLAGEMQPGFLQLQREDATIQFGQQQAVILVGGSWSANSMRSEIPFEIGVNALPLPERGDADWGAGVRGPVGDNAGLFFEGLALPVGGKQRELAIDFLRFFSSWKAYSRYVEKSGCLPVVKQVAPTEQMKPFALRQDGFRPGPTIYSTGEATRRLWDQNIQMLLPPKGTVEGFLDFLGKRLPGTVAADMTRWRRDTKASFELQDLLVEARHQLALFGTLPETRLGTLLDSQSATEAQYYASFAKAAPAPVLPELPLRK
jgi:raffinose/stachyose/melibiose transport system substrate-binding protein